MHCPLVDCKLAVGAEEESLPRRMRRHMEAKKALRVWRAQPSCSQCKDTGANRWVTWGWQSSSRAWQAGGGADVYIRCGLSQDQEAEWARQRLDPPTRVGDFRLGVEITQALGHTPDQVVCWGWGPSYPAQPFRVPLCACFHSLKNYKIHR